MVKVALWEFEDAGWIARDSATGDGAQDGVYLNGAASSSGQAVFDGCNDYIKVAADDVFQLPEGQLEVTFTPDCVPYSGEQAILSRDSAGLDNGGHFGLWIEPCGVITIRHQTETGSEYFSTPQDFYSAGDEITVTYAWSDTGEGGFFHVENKTTGEIYDEEIAVPLTMDMSSADPCEDFNEPWVIGASQERSSDNKADCLIDFFDGKIDYVAIYDTVDGDEAEEPVLNGVVSGTSGDDLIDIAYLGDPEGDRIDAGDGTAGTTGDQDVVEAGAGNDTVYAGLAEDTVFAGTGNDSIYGQDADDALYGEDGDDALFGGTGLDSLFGGTGNDTLDGGSGGDIADGGTGSDVFIGGAGDVITGGEDGDGQDIDVLDLSGLGPNKVINYTGGDPASESGTVDILDGDGNVTGSLSFSEIERVICFVPGTAIATPRGEMRVEQLKAGDRVITRDNGIQKIAWIGRKTLSAADLMANPKLRPVVIRKGSLGDGLPERDMAVSPNHRMLMMNESTELLFDDREVLAPAKHLTGLDGVDQVPANRVTYLHVMFEQHEIILANGAWTESFQPGDYSLEGVEPEQREELFELFPELRSPEGTDAYAAARKSLKKHETALLVR